MFPPAPSGSPHILLIDDSPDNLRILLDLIASRHWRASVAFDGNDGFQKALMRPPDLILLDVNMPGIDGFACCHLLKSDARTRHIPVIFLTAADEKEARLRGLACGAVDYVCKPFASDEEVLARIGIHLLLARGQSGAAPAASDTPRIAPTVLAAVRILRENLANPPTPEVLARLVGTHERRLNESFHAAFALPVWGWLREERLRSARELLEQTSMAVSDIAHYCGYTSAANFATAFRERFDCSPRDYRRSLIHPAPGGPA